MRSRVARVIVRGLLAALFRVRHYGMLPPRGPLLVVANHQGWVDGFLLAASFPLSAEVRLLGDREGTGKVWWWRAVLRAVGMVITIERTSKTADRAAIAATVAALERGEVVIVFAEGRVSRVESALGPFERGVGYLALRSGAPVLPVWLRVVPKGVPTKGATLVLARVLHDDLARLEPSERAREPAHKRMRWLTNLF